MSFQIKDRWGKVISINELDREAAALWNKEVHDTEYAYPIKLPEEPSAREIAYAIGGNWFDVIGYAIHRPEKYAPGWDDVKCTLWTIQCKDLFKIIMETESVEENTHLLIRLQGMKDFLKPYFDLINHWESKHYIPVNIKE